MKNCQLSVVSYAMAQSQARSRISLTGGARNPIVSPPNAFAPPPPAVRVVWHWEESHDLLLSAINGASEEQASLKEGGHQNATPSSPLK